MPIKKTLLSAFLVSAAALSAAPAVYSILPISTPPNVTDSSIAEWTEGYFIDSLRSDGNIFARDDTLPWAASDFQYTVYAAHDEDWIYFMMKIIADDALQTGSSTGCDDAFVINAGGHSTVQHMFINGTIGCCAVTPWAMGSTFFGRVNPAGNGLLATVEFKLDKAVLDAFNRGYFIFSLGFVDGDTPDCMNTLYGAIGVEYTGPKQDWNNNPWDSAAYYPTFHLTPIKVESKVTAKTAEILTVSPNPFTPTTTLSYNVKSHGFLTIYDMAGKIMKSFAVKVGAGSVEWKAEGMASGIYVARLKSGGAILNTRLFLTR